MTNAYLLIVVVSIIAVAAVDAQFFVRPGQEPQNGIMVDSMYGFLNCFHSISFLSKHYYSNQFVANSNHITKWMYGSCRQSCWIVYAKISLSQLWWICGRFMWICSLMLCLYVKRLVWFRITGNPFKKPTFPFIDQGSCRSVVTSNETYFVSPSYPTLLTSRIDPPVCIFTLQRNPVILKLPVCQIRIDFDEFTLAPHFDGVCGNGITDSFLVSGAANFNQTGLPTTGLCGEMTGQHSKIYHRI